MTRARQDHLRGSGTFGRGFRQTVAWNLPLALALLHVTSSPAAAGTISYQDGFDRLVRDTTVGEAGIAPNNASPIEVRGDTVYVVFDDSRLPDGLRHCYLARSTNGAATFEPNVQVDGSPSWAVEPNMVVPPAGAVLVTWWDYRDGSGTYGGGNIYLARSLDGGITFAEETRVDDTAGPDEARPAIAAGPSGNEVYVIWEDDRPMYNDSSFLVRSLDGGLSFFPSVRVPDELTVWPQKHPSVEVADDGTVYACADVDMLYWPTPVVSASEDSGQSFPVFVPMYDPGDSWPNWATSCAMDGSMLHVGWIEDLGYLGEQVVFVNAVLPGNTSVRGRVRVHGNAAVKDGLSIAATRSGRVYAAWVEDTPPSGQAVYFAGSADGGLTFGPVIRVSDAVGHYVEATGVGVDPAGDGSTVFVTWCAVEAGGSADVYIDRVDVTVATSVTDQGGVTARLALSPPAPSPVRTSAVFTIRRASAPSEASLAIHDARGREVWRHMVLNPVDGALSLTWDGLFADARPAPSGVYFATLVGHDVRETVKFLVIR